MVLPDLSDGLADALTRSLTRRMAEVKAAAERLQGFAFAPDEPVPELIDEGNEQATLRDMILRALSRAVDPVNFSLMEELADSDRTVARLAEALVLPRSAVSERVNDLLQVGLVHRTHTGDGVVLSEGGRAIVELVSVVVDQGRGTS